MTLLAVLLNKLTSLSGLASELLTVVVVVLTAQSLQTLRTPNIQQSAAITTLPSPYDSVACTVNTVSGTQLFNLGNETSQTGSYLTNIDYSLSVYASASPDFVHVGAAAGSTMKAQLDTIFATYGQAGFPDGSYTNNWGGLNSSFYLAMDSTSGSCAKNKVPDPLVSAAAITCLTNSNISICMPDDADQLYYWAFVPIDTYYCTQGVGIHLSINVDNTQIDVQTGLGTAVILNSLMNFFIAQLKQQTAPNFLCHTTTVVNADYLSSPQYTVDGNIIYLSYAYAASYVFSVVCRFFSIVFSTGTVIVGHSLYGAKGSQVPMAMTAGKTIGEE